MNWQWNAYAKDAIVASQEVYEQWLDVLVKPLQDTDKVIIACAGTEDLGDWLINFAFLFNRDLVHRGFYNNANRLLPLVLDRISHYEVGRPLILTGHSLGGATAMILGSILKEWGYNVQEIITFGCPRVGNKKFSNYYASLSIPTTHYVHGSDVVPATPPWLLGFRNLPGLRILIPNKKWFRIISDHRISNYLKHFINHD